MIGDVNCDGSIDLFDVGPTCYRIHRIFSSAVMFLDTDFYLTGIGRRIRAVAPIKSIKT